MKKIGNKIKQNAKAIAAFVLGIVLAGGTVYAATVLPSSQVGYDNSTSGLAATDVQGALDELYAKASKAPVKLGDYVSLTPSQTSYTIKTSLTGYTSDQTINPSELNLWRVIDIHSDGSFDAVSEYVSSTGVYFRGAIGYANVVGGLQTIAAQYAKSEYTISTRMIGYAGQTPTIVDRSTFDGSQTTPASTISSQTPTTGIGEEYSGGVAGDTLYLKDYSLVKKVYGSVKANKVGTSTSTDYWLASRSFLYGNTSYIEYYAIGVSYEGNLQRKLLRRYEFGKWVDANPNYSLRPIITLKSGITTSGGSGTKDSPYSLQ